MKLAHTPLILFILAALFLSACGGGAQPTPTTADTTPLTEVTPTVVTAATPTSAPTHTPTPAPTATPTPAPTATPTSEPTATPTPEPTLAPSACNNPFLPVAVGREWVYRMSGPVGTNEFTRSIATLTENGFTDRDTFDVGTVREGEWRCEDGDLIALSPGSQAAVSVPDMRFTFTVESNEGVTLPADLAPGKTWSQRMVYSGRQTVGDLTMDTRNDLTIQCRAIGEEPVTVPAGAFTAMRVECTHAMKVTVQEFTVSIESTGVVWYAKGVGMVKSLDESAEGSTEIVLVATRP